MERKIKPVGSIRIEFETDNYTGKDVLYAKVYYPLGDGSAKGQIKLEGSDLTWARDIFILDGSRGWWALSEHIKSLGDDFIALPQGEVVRRNG